MQHVDLAPTILDLAKAPIPGNLRGRSLAPLFEPDGSIAKTASTWQDAAADASGTIGWVRFKDNTNTYVMDLDVTNNAGTGAVKVDNPTLVLGQQFIVSTATLTMPAST